MSSTYALRPPEVFEALESSPEGLTPAEAQARLSLYGPNVLAEPPETPLWRKLLAHAAHPMALLLWAAAGLALLAGRPLLGVVIGLVVCINAGFSFWQEYRAQRALAVLKQLLPAYARVIRAGTETRLPAAEIVAGDVLVLAEGDNIPADARVVEAYGLRTNEAALTGEALPSRKTAEASLREGLTELERPNLVFAGTSVVSGTGRAVVFATGMLSQFGRIANLTQAVEEPSVLQQQMARVTRIITWAALGLGAIVFVAGVLEVGFTTFNALLFALGIIVATVPEGLLPTVTLSLAMAVQRLAQRGVLVKQLALVERLGATSVICTDKSGTLTQNQMTVREVWVAGQRLSISGVGYEPKGDFSLAHSSSHSGAENGRKPGPALKRDLDSLLTAAMLCNNARLNPPAPGEARPQWSSLGDPTEAALRVAAIKGGIDEPATSAAYPRIHELPFDARRKRMSTIHKWQVVIWPRSGPNHGDLAAKRAKSWQVKERPVSPAPRHPAEIAFVKGAPKEVLALCSHVLMDGEVRPLGEATHAEILAANDDYARRALRVLALARRDLPPRDGPYTPEGVERNLTFLGLLAMMDPPRPEVAEAVQTLRAAGIRLVMITGDYGLTAESLARRVGLLASDRPHIITGADVEAMDDAALRAALEEEAIFARMAPEHKLRVVAALQARGEVVAVMGDGVNDAPALRKADIGVAMGVTGTDVAKEAADVILTDDNFAALVSAIEEGRGVFDNLRKFVTYIFSSNVPQIMPFMLTALFNIPLALTVTQLLAIDMGTDLLPALALGAEKPEPNVMRRPPRRRGQTVLDSGLFKRALWLGLIETVLCYAGFFFVYAANGYTGWLNLPRVDLLPFAARLATPAGQVYILATTIFHAGVVAAQVGNAFTCRTEKERVHRLGWLSNRFLIFGVAFEVAVIVLLIYVRPLAALFEHLPLPWYYWGGLILYAPTLYSLDRIRKSIARWRDKAQAQRRG